MGQASDPRLDQLAAELAGAMNDLVKRTGETRFGLSGVMQLRAGVELNDRAARERAIVAELRDGLPDELISLVGSGTFFCDSGNLHLPVSGVPPIAAPQALKQYLLKGGGMVSGDLAEQPGRQDKCRVP